MPTPPREHPSDVLLIEDNPGDARLIQEMLTDAPSAPFRLVWVKTLAQGVARLEDGGIAAILLDLFLPDSHGLPTFRVVHARFPDVPSVVLSGLNDEDVALNAVRDGAQDYLIKGRVDGKVLAQALRYAVERQQLLRQAQEAVHLRDLVLAAVSHDLRSPLTVIGVSAQAIDAILNGELGPVRRAEVRGWTERIASNSQRMATMIDELADVTSLQSGRPLTLKLRSFDLVTLARALVDDYLKRAPGFRITLDAAEPKLIGDWDAERLRRVVDNLLGNAVKYSEEPGEILVRIARETRDE